MMKTFYILRKSDGDPRLRLISAYEIREDEGTRSFTDVNSIDSFVEDTALTRVGDITILQTRQYAAVEVIARDSLPEGANACHVGSRMNVPGTDYVNIAVQYFRLDDSQLHGTQRGLLAGHKLLNTPGLR